jgi:hypothetical protein
MATLEGRGFLPLALLLALLAGRLCALPDYPFIEETWRPDRGVVVATFDGEAITQEDVFLWQAIRGRDPMVARLASQSGVDARALRPLVEAVRDLAEARLLAREAIEAGAVEPWYREKGSRVLAAPIAFMVFADLVVRPEVTVATDDLLHYYRTNRARFEVPAEVDAVRIRIPLPNPEDSEQRTAALIRADALRAEAIRGGGVTELLARYPDLAVEQPVGATMRLVRGRGPEWRNTMDEVFRMAVSQISTPLVHGDGVYLYEVLNRRPARARPFEEVREEIQARLARRFFRQQLEFHIQRVVEAALPINRVRHYALLEDEMELVLVGGFVLTKGEFATLFPDETANESGRRPSRPLTAATRLVVECEAVTQYLAANGFDSHRGYVRARELAGVLAAARKALKLEREVPEPTPDDLRAFVQANRDELAPEWTSFLWKLTATPKEARDLGPTERAAIAARMQALLDDVVREAERLLEDRARINGPIVYVSPQFVVERVVRPDQGDFTVTFERAGDFTAAQARRTWSVDLESIAVGRFTPPLPRGDGTVVALYRADQAERAATDEAELLARARTAWRRDLAENPAREKLAELERQGRFRMMVP